MMGSSLDKPSDRLAVCPLCHSECWDQITLECGHGFCRKCVKEVWSGASGGPYYCFECDHEIRKLPDAFGDTDGASTSTGSTRISTDTAHFILMPRAFCLLLSFSYPNSNARHVYDAGRRWVSEPGAVSRSHFCSYVI